MDNSDLIHLSTYSGHTCPGILFDGVANRFALWLARKESHKAKIYTSKYLKWYTAERSSLFQSIFYGESIDFHQGTTYKSGNVVSKHIIKKLVSPGTLSNVLIPDGNIYVYITPIHWMKAFDFKPYFKGNGKTTSTQLKPLPVASRYKNAVIALLNSSLFFWWWITMSDCYHLTSREVENFPIEFTSLDEQTLSSLNKLAVELMRDLNDKSHIGTRNQKTTGLVEFQVIDPKISKPIIDEIDKVLAKHYGFTDEELDFILHYDIKYRMGKDAAAEDDAEE